MGYICVNCGNVIEMRDTEGSMVCPFCKPCFMELFNNDYNKYKEFLSKGINFEKKMIDTVISGKIRFNGRAIRR